MRDRIRNGFTIVEMLMVVAVLAVLMGIVGTAATSAIRQARSRKAKALQQCVQVGVATYYAQKGYWPPKSGKIQQLADKGIENGKSSYTLTDAEYDAVMTEIATVSVKGKNAVPVMDVNGLIVAQKGVANRRDASGREFREAIKKRKRASPMKLSDMAFGYQESSHGYFRRFRMTYNAASDSVTVDLQ